MTFHLIYTIVNPLTNKYYVGMHSTNDLNDGYMGSGVLIETALQKYGKDAFDFVPIQYCSSRQELIKREIEIITQELIKDPLCYNLRCGGKGFEIGNKGRKPTQEHIKNQSLSQKGKKLSEEHKAKISKSMLGKTLSEETKNKIRKSLIGYKHL